MNGLNYDSKLMKNWKLEFIRGGAALLVFFCHLVINNPVLKSKNYLNILSNWGTEAVILFFMLSGVVINLSQKRKYNTSFTFLKNRLLRIYPLYFVGILLAIIAILVLKTEKLNLYNMLGNLFFIGTLQSYIISIPSSNPVIWSLSFEMSFYLIYCFLIGNDKIKFMFIWLCISLLSIPFYYLQIKDWLGFLIIIFSFSSIWLIGYYVGEYAYKIKVASFKVAIIFLSLLPAISRLHITTQYYDVLKYCIFSMCASPFFLYCIADSEIYANTEKYFITLKHVKIAMILVFVSLLLLSDSLFLSKIIYITIPISILLFKINIPNYVKNILIKSSLYFGSISYVLYIIHFPILLLINYFSNGYPLLYIISSILIIFPLCNFLEFKYQKFFVSICQKGIITVRNI